MDAHQKRGMNFEEIEKTSNPNFPVPYYAKAKKTLFHRCNSTFRNYVVVFIPHNFFFHCFLLVVTYYSKKTQHDQT